MAKRQSSSERVLNVVLIAAGIFLIVAGVTQSDSQSMQAILLTAGLVLQVTGTIGFAKVK
jgi:hypothetical protein